MALSILVQLLVVVHEGPEELVRRVMIGLKIIEIEWTVRVFIEATPATASITLIFAQELVCQLGLSMVMSTVAIFLKTLICASQMKLLLRQVNEVEDKSHEEERLEKTTGHSNSVKELSDTDRVFGAFITDADREPLNNFTPLTICKLKRVPRLRKIAQFLDIQEGNLTMGIVHA